MRRFFFFSWVFLGLLGCTSGSKEADKGGGAATGSWPERMQSMARNLEELMPYVYSQKEFSDGANRKRVSQLIENFERSVELVPQHLGEKILGSDPLIKYSISRLKANTNSARKAFEENHLEFSRNVLRENLGLCFSCHTTSQLGPQNAFSKKILDASFRIAPTERADYYVATRQFDRAIDMLRGVLKSPGHLMDDPHEQVSALRKYLSLEVRVKKDPEAATSLLEEFLSNKRLPYFIATDAEAWLKSLREWSREKNHKNESYKRALVVLNKAHGQQSSDGYQTAYVEFLRASSLLHDGLRETRDKAMQAEIYYNLGMSYEALSEMGTWDLPEVYFETCVRVVAKTQLAKKCFKAYERTIVLGFSGSAGTFIPKEERERLAELKALSGLE